MDDVLPSLPDPEKHVVKRQEAPILVDPGTPSVPNARWALCRTDFQLSPALCSIK